jgi:L-ascorbate metabolism protein UlaG (beta-lactamase superfamily)
MRALLASPFVLLLAAAAWQEATAPTVELELVYLANEGFLVRAGADELVIDAFVTEPYGPYAAVPPELRADMLARKPPFEDVGLALTSHNHRDHFQVAAAAEFLRAHPETRFLSSPQVADELLAELGVDPVAERVAALLPEGDARLDERRGGVAVELLRLPHSGGSRTASVQNLGHLLTLGGARVLHVGDADIATAALDAADIERAEVDVALVPYWWLGDAQGLARARDLTGAKHLVAVHVPPGEVAEVKQHLAQLDRTVILFETPGEKRVLTLAR